jgi:hypothetical protein
MLRTGSLQKSNASDLAGAAVTIVVSGFGKGVPGSRNRLVIG